MVFMDYQPLYRLRTVVFNIFRAILPFGGPATSPIPPWSVDVKNSFEKFFNAVVISCSPEMASFPLMKIPPPLFENPDRRIFHVMIEELLYYQRIEQLSYPIICVVFLQMVYLLGNGIITC